MILLFGIVQLLIIITISVSMAIAFLLALIVSRIFLRPLALVLANEDLNFVVKTCALICAIVGLLFVLLTS